MKLQVPGAHTVVMVVGGASMLFASNAFLAAIPASQVPPPVNVAAVAVADQAAVAAAASTSSTTRAAVSAAGARSTSPGRSASRRTAARAPGTQDTDAIRPPRAEHPATRATQPRRVDRELAAAAEAAAGSTPSSPTTPTTPTTPTVPTALPAFTVAMFNILGSQHTAAHGDAHGYASGTTRAATAASLLTSRGVSLVGFSEIQRDQLAVVKRRMPSFRFYPDTSAGGAGVPQSLGWDSTVWTATETYTFKIPFNHQIRPQPAVHLTHNATGAGLWMVNVHNSPQGMQAERDAASAIEVEQIRKLAAGGEPVVLTGDFNERAVAMCRFTSATPLVSAVGGTNGPGGCSPPRGARVDWIFASPSLTNGGYVVDRRAPIPSITDHAVLFATLSAS